MFAESAGLEGERFGFAIRARLESRAESVARDMLLAACAPGATPLPHCDRDVIHHARKERVMKRLFVLPLLVLFLAGASNVLAQDVRYNFAKETNFATFKTYKWVPDQERRSRSAIWSTDQIKGAIDARTCNERPHADGGRHCGPATSATRPPSAPRNSTRRSTPATVMVQAGTVRGWYGGGGMSTTTGTTSTIYVGQLALDMYVPAQKSLVWRGTASKTLDTKAKPEKQQKNLAKAVAKLLKNYPPPVKK